MFTIPLRRALIIAAGLRFPEGVATAEVLKVRCAGDGNANGFRYLLSGTLVGGIFKAAGTGLGLWTDVLEGAARVSGVMLCGGRICALHWWPGEPSWVSPPGLVVRAGGCVT